MPFTLSEIVLRFIGFCSAKAPEELTPILAFPVEGKEDPESCNSSGVCNERFFSFAITR